jgi:hypothetical protein
MQAGWLLKEASNREIVLGTVLCPPSLTGVYPEENSRERSQLASPARYSETQGDARSTDSKSNVEETY